MDCSVLRKTSSKSRFNKFLCGIMLACSVSASVGCIIPGYSAIKSHRAEQLIYTSENLRAITQEWERFWFLDMPDHMTPYRVHGGII